MAQLTSFKKAEASFWREMRHLEMVRRAQPKDIRSVHSGIMIDLNTATAGELDDVPELKGHGFEIVRYRDERGRFDTLRQLDEVPGLTGKWDDAEARVSVS